MSTKMKPAIDVVSSNEQYQVSPTPWQPSMSAELAEVMSHVEVNAEYRHLVVSCSAIAASATAGQFFQLLCPQSLADQPFLRRPMSVYGVDAADCTLEFLYKVAGAGTRGLERLMPGDRVDIMGPLGVGFHLDPHWNHIVAIGRGAGLATLAPVAKMARLLGVQVTVILSARSPELLVSDDYFREQGADVISVTDTDLTSGPANVERILRKLIAGGKCDAFLTCGSNRLAQVQQRLAVEFNIPGQIAVEQQMACGLGMCFCCVRDFNVGGEIVHKRVCWDGPVFDLLETTT